MSIHQAKKGRKKILGRDTEGHRAGGALEAGR